MNNKGCWFQFTDSDSVCVSSPDFNTNNILLIYIINKFNNTFIGGNKHKHKQKQKQKQKQKREERSIILFVNEITQATPELRVIIVYL